MFVPVALKLVKPLTPAPVLPILAIEIEAPVMLRELRGVEFPIAPDIVDNPAPLVMVNGCAPSSVPVRET